MSSAQADTEAARFAALIAQLSPTEQAAAFEQLPAAVKEVGVIWKDGKEPIPFDEFCVALDGCPLYPRQLQPFVDTGLLRASAFLSPDRVVREFVLLHGKGAGKDYLISKLMTYLTYCTLCIEGDPCVYFRQWASNLGPESELSLLNVADNEDTAKRIYFGYLKRWMAHPLLKQFSPDIYSQNIHFYGISSVTGEPYKKVSLYSMTSSSKGLEGYNCLAWVMDEADAFQDSEQRSNADALHDILRTSANTRMGKMWLGAIITYTRFEEGFAMRMYKRATEGDEATRRMYYADLAATWEVNPRFDRNSEEVVEMYTYRPREAAMLYECSPSTVGSAFIEFPEKIKQAVNTLRSPCAIVEVGEIRRESQSSVDGISRYEGILSIEGIRREPNRVYFMGGDAGAKKDSFFLCITSTEDGGLAPEWLCPLCGQHTELREGLAYQPIEAHEEVAKWTDKLQKIYCGACMRSPVEIHPSWGTRHWWHMNALSSQALHLPGGRVFHLPHIREELLVEIRPQYAGRNNPHNRPVDFVHLMEFLPKLVSELDIKRARFDPWQTITITQQIVAETSIDAAEISFSNPEQVRRGTLYKTMLYAGLLDLLPNARRDREVRRLQLVGSKLDHPKPTAATQEGKDAYDAESVAVWAAATYHCSELEISWS